MSDIILIIEDNKEIRENITEILRLASYKVLDAPNGRAGVELARKNNPALVLCDIVMPELDGYKVLNQLKDIPQMAGIPFIFMSAKSEGADLRIAMNLGADDYIVKPFSADELLCMVSKRLQKPFTGNWKL